MARVTSKLQFTIPKAVAEKHGIGPGCELEMESADDVIRLRVVDSTEAKRKDGVATALDAFDFATKRQEERESSAPSNPDKSADRGWQRDDLYNRDLAR